MSAPSNKRSARPLVWFVLIVALLAGGGYLAVLELRPVAVVEPVISAPAIDAKPGSVTVAEDYSFDVRSELPGRILSKDFNLKLGQFVHAGQVLVRLDPKDLELLLQKTKIDYEATKAHFQLDQSEAMTREAAETDFANAKRAHETGTMSDQDFAAAERRMKGVQQMTKLSAIDRAQQLDTFKNTIETQQRQVDKMVLTAPVDGVVKEVMAHPGELINAASPIATLITVKKNVLGKISDENFAEIKVGQAAVVTFIPYGGFIYHGSVAQILPTTDPQTQRHIVYLDVTDIAQEKLVPGINGELAVTVGRHQAHAVVPRRAVFSTDGDNVFVVKDGVVHVRRVKEGFVWSTGVEITEGLEPGEQVIVEGLEDFRDGDRVAVHAVPSDIKSS